MDHSYRNQGNGNSMQGARFHNGAQASPNMEPLTQRVDAPTKIFAFVDDLFFVAKIQEVSRKLNVKVEFVKTDKDITEKTEGSEEKPSLIIVDLNSNGIKPLPVITKMRSKYKKATSIVGFVSHVQGDLKVKARKPAAMWSCRARRSRKTWLAFCAATAQTTIRTITFNRA